ncbi:MAG: hypothetical protein PVJ62_00750, partial [Deltaproteobacteria bacterium]
SPTDWGVGACHGNCSMIALIECAHKPDKKTVGPTELLTADDVKGVRHLCVVSLGKLTPTGSLRATV